MQKDFINQQHCGLTLSLNHLFISNTEIVWQKLNKEPGDLEDKPFKQNHMKYFTPDEQGEEDPPVLSHRSSTTSAPMACMRLSIIVLLAAKI